MNTTLFVVCKKYKGGETKMVKKVFLSVFVFFGLILNSCAKKEATKPAEEKKPITSDESVSYSLQGVGSAVKVSSAVAKSVSSMKAKDNVQQSMITGRMLTHRAPQLKLSQSPKFGGSSSSKKAGSRIKSKANTDVCSEQEKGIYLHFQDEQGSLIQFWFSLDNGTLNISGSSNEGKEGFLAWLVNCSEITLSCNGINTSQDAFQYFNQLTSQALQRCIFEGMSFWYTDGFGCTISDFDHNGKFSVSYSYYLGNNWSSQPATSVFIDESGFANVSYCDSHGSCDSKNYNCPVGSQLFQNLSCGGREQNSDINSLYYVVNNIGSYCTLTYSESSRKIGGGTCSWGTNQVRIEVENKAIIFNAEGAGLKGEVLQVRFCDRNFGGGRYLGQACKIYISDVRLGSGNCQFSFDCQSFGNDITSALQYANSVSKNCSVKLSGFWEDKEGKEGISCLKYDFSGDGLADLLRSEHYPGGDTEVLISGTGDGTKRFCQFSGEDSFSCDEYSATGCSGSLSEKDCSFSCKTQWVLSGYSTSEGGCFKEDVDNDGEGELIVYVEGQNKLSGVIANSDKSSVGLDCSFSSSSADIVCKVKVGSCNIAQCPSKGADLNSVISSCSMKDYAECSLTSEEENSCFNIVLSLLSKEGDGVSYCSKVDEKSGENVKIKKIKEGYEYSKGSAEKGFTTYTCPESSKVDFSQCSISGCEISEKTADIVASLSDFASEGTKQTYTMKISDTKAGIEGEIKVVYYVLDDIAEIEGVLKTKAGNIELSGKVKGDGSADISLKMKLADGKEIKGGFSFKSDGSGTGIITADNKKYNVKFNADGTGEICDEANKCESFS
jgi:hypothetical protein